MILRQQCDRSDSTKFRFGLVGAGAIGLKRSLNVPQEAEIVSMYDPSPASRKKFRDHGLDHIELEDDVKLVVENPDIDGVIIATPHRYLAEHAIAVIRAGKHCFVEKPGGVSLAEIHQIGEESRRAGVTVRFGFNHRFHPSIKQAKALIEDGELGRVIGIRGAYGHGGRPGYESEWRHKRDISGGGELVDQGSHLVDLVQFLAGPATLEFSCLRNQYWTSDVEDNVYLVLSVQNGAIAFLHASWTEWKNLFRLEIALERGRIDILGLGGSYGVETLTVYIMSAEMGPPSRNEHVFTAPDASWSHELNHFIRAVQGQPDNCADVPQTASVWSLIEAAYST